MMMMMMMMMLMMMMIMYCFKLLETFLFCTFDLFPCLYKQRNQNIYIVPLLPCNKIIPETSWDGVISATHLPLTCSWDISSPKGYLETERTYVPTQ